MHGLRRAFTLIELLAVVVILAVLAGAAIPKFIDMQDRAKEAACKGLLGGVRAGIASYFANEAITNGVGAYPWAYYVDNAASPPAALFWANSNLVNENSF